MTLSRVAPVAILAAALFASGCANTIRGVGRDAAGTVNATQNAAGNVGRAVSR